MLLREIIFGRRSQFPRLAKATGFDFLCFPGDLDASMFTKMALGTIYIRVDERVQQVFDQPGGIIVLPVDDNVLETEANLVPRIKSFLTSINEITELTIGRFLRGRYRSQRRLNFDETSVSAEVIGIETEVSLKLSTTLANEFHHETVFVKDYSTHNIYLADKHPLSLADLLKIRAKR